MHKRKQPQIRIYPVEGSSDRYVASFSSEVLNATFSVVFHETITGAVALNNFAEMIRTYYGVSPVLTVVDQLPNNPAVSDVLQSLEHPPATGSHHL